MYTHPLFKKAISFPKKRTEDATIITWNTFDESCLLEQRQECVVLGRNVEDWHNYMKVSTAREFLSQVDTKYTMGFDGFDVILIDPQKIIDRFEQKNCSMLISTDRDYFPCGMDPITSKWKRFQESVCGDVEYKYLNAGSWIAETKFLKLFLDCCLKKHEDIQRWVVNKNLPQIMPSYHVQCCDHLIVPKKSPDKSEQMIFNSVFPELYPDVQLDYLCEVFQTVNHCQDVELVNLI